MNEVILASVVRAMKLAVFQRDAHGGLRQVGCGTEWLTCLWPQANQNQSTFDLGVSQFLANFLIDAEDCWSAGGNRRVDSGPWIEKDATGHEYHLQAAAFTVEGNPTLVVEELGPDFDLRREVLQKAREAALAYERLQEAEAALAEEKRLLEQRVRERTAALVKANEELRGEVATRLRFAERLKTMNEIDRAILAARSPEAVAEAALHHLHQLLPCDRASVIEVDSENRQGTVLASFRRGERIAGEGWVLSPEQLLKSRTLLVGQPHCVRSAQNLFQAATDRAETVKIWQFILDLPMVAEGTLIGVLNLATDVAEGFTAEHQETALDIAAQLAVAVRQARLFEQVRRGRERLREVSLRLLQVQESERRAIARELHDEIGQLLTGLKLSLEMRTRATHPAAPLDLAEPLGMLNELVERVRQLSLNLRPQMLDDLGLLTALEWHFKRYSTQTGIQVQFRHQPLPLRLPDAIETAIFRIVQEALTNVARHARVPIVTVRLWKSEESAGVQIEDAGTGFDVTQLSSGHSSGLSGMRERAELLGGEFVLESAPGKGTKLTVELPLHA